METDYENLRQLRCSQHNYEDVGYQEETVIQWENIMYKTFNYCTLNNLSESSVIQTKKIDLQNPPSCQHIGIYVPTIAYRQR